MFCLNDEEDQQWTSLCIHDRGTEDYYVMEHMLEERAQELLDSAAAADIAEAEQE